MTYTLEINHINPRENLFFYQSGIPTPEMIEEYITPIVNKHIAKRSWIGDYTYYDNTISVIQRPTGEWQRITRIKNFTSIEAATEFFTDVIADGTEYRALLRAWNQEHGILNETNILDEHGKIVNVVHACQAHKCLRFGSCPEQGQGCNVVGSTVKSGPHPVYHMTPVITNTFKKSFNLFSNGRYGLVDLYYRNIWFNTYSEKIAHEVQQTFWAKAAMVVFDLTFFENYTEDLIDSEVSLGWKIDTTDLLSPLTAISLSNTTLTETQTSYTSTLLHNLPTTTLLDSSRQKELQQEMLFYVLILKVADWDVVTWEGKDLEFINNMRQIFQTEIGFNTIKEKIIDLASKSLTGPASLATDILELLNSKYA